MKRDEVFEVLEPPVGGLTRLRARLAERRSTRVGRWVLAAVLAAAAVTVVVGVPEREPAPDFTAALTVMGTGQGVEGRGESAVEALPSSDPKVQLYRVGSLSSREDPREE